MLVYNQNVNVMQCDLYLDRSRLKVKQDHSRHSTIPMLFSPAEPSPLGLERYTYFVALASSAIWQEP